MSGSRQGPPSRPPPARSAAHSIADGMLHRSKHRKVPTGDITANVRTVKCRSVWAAQCEFSPIPAGAWRAIVQRFENIGLSPGVGMRRRDFITLLGGAVSWPLAARGEDRRAVPLVGVLLAGRPDVPGR